jgi:hypothetical protein
MPTFPASPARKIAAPTTYQILYTWQGRHYRTTMPHYSAYSALSAAEMMIMPGAKAYAIEAVAL